MTAGWNQGGLLKPQALIHFNKIFFAIPLGISLISCSYTQPPCWLTVMDYFPFNLHPFTAYFYKQRYSKDHFMQLKLGDVSRIEIKNHDVLLPKPS